MHRESRLEVLLQPHWGKYDDGLGLIVALGEMLRRLGWWASWLIDVAGRTRTRSDLCPWGVVRLTQPSSKLPLTLVIAWLFLLFSFLSRGRRQMVAAEERARNLSSSPILTFNSCVTSVHSSGAPLCHLLHLGNGSILGS